MPGPRKLTKGQNVSGIPADGWNGFVDAYRIVQQLRPQVDGSRLGRADDRAIVVTLKNDSGSAVVRGGVLKLGAPIVTPATRAEVVLEGVLFDGDTPEADKPDQQIGIALAPVPDGEPGPFAVVGLVWAQLNITDAAHTFAKPKASTAELESDASTGFPVIWKESGTGSKWAVVSLSSPGGSSIRWGEATTSISATTAWGTWGGGSVQPKDDDGNDDGSPISVENRYWDPFEDKSIVCYDTKYTPARIVSVGCTPAT